MENFVIVGKKKLKINMLKIKNIIKVGIIVIIHGNIKVISIAYVI